MILQHFSKLTNTKVNEWTTEVMKNIQRLLNSYAYGVFVCQCYLCISEGVSFNLHQNGMKKIRKTMIKELSIIQLRGRTLITPSSIPDGAIENHHMAHDNCYVALSDISYAAVSPIQCVPIDTLWLPCWFRQFFRLSRNTIHKSLVRIPWELPYETRVWLQTVSRKVQIPYNNFNR